MTFNNTIFKDPSEPLDKWIIRKTEESTYQTNNTMKDKTQKHENGERQTIDITPTWQDAMKIYQRIYDSVTPEAKQLFWEEVQRMAKRLDEINAEHKHKQHGK